MRSPTLRRALVALIGLIIASLMLLLWATPSGAQQIDGYEVVQQDYTIPAGTDSAIGTLDATAECPAGKVLLGGGYQHDHPDPGIALVGVRGSGPDSAAAETRWLVRAWNDTSNEFAIHVYAICAQRGSASSAGSASPNAREEPIAPAAPVVAEPHFAG